MKFTSKNSAIATVSEQGTVVGVSSGSTVIEVKEDNGEYRGQIPTTVVANDSSYIPVTGITLNKTSVNLKYAYNFSKQLKATVTPSNATNKAITWTSSNPTALTCVNGYLKCQCAGEGDFTVTASSVDGPLATCSVHIDKNGTYVTGANVSSLEVPSYACTQDITLYITNYDGYYSGITSTGSGSGIGSSKITSHDDSSAELTFSVRENYGCKRTDTLYIHGNFNDDEGIAIPVVQPAGTKVLKIYNEGQGGDFSVCTADSQFYHVYFDRKYPDGSVEEQYGGRDAMLWIQCAFGEGQTMVNGATIDKDWVSFVRVSFDFSKEQLDEFAKYGTLDGVVQNGTIYNCYPIIKVEPNPSSEERICIITFPGGVKHTIYQDGLGQPRRRKI